MHAVRPNVVLTGFMGTGKTTVGRTLAARLGAEFVDTDALVEQRHGPIPAIFAEHGEERFRALERELAEELSQRSGLVVSTGGRMMVDPVNAELLAARGVVVCLTATPETIHARVGRSIDSRPMLRGGDARARIETLLAERAPAYARFTQVTTDDRDVDEIVDEIVALLPD
jgi:shikimate kinase